MNLVELYNNCDYYSCACSTVVNANDLYDNYLL